MESHDWQVPVGSLEQPESIDFARFYKGFSITVRPVFFLAGGMLRNARISTVSDGNRGRFFGHLMCEVWET